VTGEKIGDAYFTRLYDLRNDDAKQERDNGGDNPSKPKQSNDGCESIPNAAK
jgi:hypothetical protein